MHFVRDVRPAGPYLAVISTTVGAAQTVAIALDHASFPELAGTVAGDDTIFAATASAAAPAPFPRAAAPPAFRSPAPSDDARPDIQAASSNLTGISFELRRNVTMKPIVLAFSGGLDTSWAIPYLAETTGPPGGDGHRRHRRLRRRRPGPELAARAAALGAVHHRMLDARAEYFERVLRFLIFGNVRRGGTYPLSVGAERSIQARGVAIAARELGSSTVAHGSTAAGNDQVRFEVALRTLEPEFEILAPVRDSLVSRPAQVAFLERARAAGAGARRGLFGQPRTLGDDDRRQRDQVERRSRSPRPPGWRRAAPSTRRARRRATV